MHPRQALLHWPLWVVLLVLLSAGSSRGAEFYYLMVFGSQGSPCLPRQTHTFATFVRATGQGTDPADYQLEAHTISWLPREKRIRCHALLPEEGVNLDLLPTLDRALRKEQRISMWGPFLIRKDLYERALEQVRLLESGRVKYTAIDSGHPSDHVCNCIHAVSSIVEGHRLCILSPSCGETASYYVTRWFLPWILGPGRRHDWVAARLGLDAYPICRRGLEHPLSGPVVGPIRQWLGLFPRMTR